jgi:hypothetical protein
MFFFIIVYLGIELKVKFSQSRRQADRLPSMVGNVIELKRMRKNAAIMAC